ncbi:MAG: FliM/FliN family flagellar motor C-terminal domain-containing protein [Burkholderiales bacterium]|nr:FliM/FliN family flagellar motor C-terminal domain-containing protein [Burkholderiales bacterium]
MSHRPFKRLNASERAVIAARATAALAGWCEDWLGRADAPLPATGGAAAERDDLRACTDWLSFALPAGALHVAHAGRALAVVERALAGAAAAGAEGVNPARIPGATDTQSRALAPLARQLVDGALHALLQGLAGAPTLAGAPGQTPADAWLRDGGAAWVGLCLGGDEIAVMVDAALVAQWLGPVPRPGAVLPALSQPQACLGGLPVEIKVWLGSMEIDLATLQALAPDDVLVLDSRIDQPLRITVAGAEVMPRAVLGSAAGRKAIRLTTPSSTH